MTSASNSDPTSIARRRPRFAKVLLLAFGVLLALLIAEAALRIYGFTYFNPYIVDLDVGYTLRPGAEGWWKKEALTYVKINDHGFRDRDHAIAKPPGTLRIAVLGDSFAEALQVPLEKTFTAVVEEKLQRCPQPANSIVEVLNFGVSGFSTTRELILLRKRVWSYSPDVIVLLFTTGNDVRDNSPALSEYQQAALPYFTSRDGKLILDDSLLQKRNRSVGFRLQQSFLGVAFQWIQNNSRVLGLFYAARESYQATSRGSATQGLPNSGKELGIDSQIYRETHSAEWEEAWQLTEKLILQMRDEVKAQGASFLVVTGSMSVQVNPDPVVRSEFMTRSGIQNLFYPDERIKALGQREGFGVLNLAPLLEDYARRNNTYLHGSGASSGRGHWNELGHQLAGEHIAGRLCKTIAEAN